MFDVLRFAIGTVVFWGIAGWAIWKGGWPERSVAIALLINIVVSPFIQSMSGDHGTDWGMFALDMALALTALVAAFRAHRWWPLFCSAFLLLAALTHFAQYVHLKPSGVFAYLTAVVFWDYLAVLALGFGMLEIRRPRPSPSATSLSPRD